MSPRWHRDGALDDEPVIRNHPPQQRLAHRRCYFFATMFLLMALAMWTNVVIIRPSRYSAVGNRTLDLLMDDFQDAAVTATTDLAMPLALTEARRARPVDTSRPKEPTSRLRPPPLPRSASLSNASFVAACLLVKDDNEILGEWIAYHYFALKLRRLVVAVDPLSRESPRDILEQWRRHTDLEVSEWRDIDYMPAEFLALGRPPAAFLPPSGNDTATTGDTTPLEVINHRYRQRVFLAACLKQNRRLGSSWVMHIDTDEYVTASQPLRQAKPEYVRLAPLDNPGSLFDLLRHVVAKTPGLVGYPCLLMLRLLFGAVERPALDGATADAVPAGLDAARFETLRWRYHAAPRSSRFHGYPKSLVDVSAVPEAALPEVVDSVHRPLEQYCPRYRDLKYDQFQRQPIGVNHYLGSWERYSRRPDQRRSRDIYERKANLTDDRDDGLQSWLSGFVRHFGMEKATLLLGNQYLFPKAA